MLTVILTSSRVAPGLLSWEAWAALREAVLVFVPSDAHPQAPALVSAGIGVRSGVAADAAEAAVGGKRVVWLAPPDEDFSGEGFPSDGFPVDGFPVEEFRAGESWGSGEVPPRVLHGSEDLPGAHLIDAVAVMDTLRVSCPWDREQTHSSLLKHLLEEAYEAAEAIEMLDFAGMREELGDVLFQAVFHARVASERPASAGGFTIDDVADVLVAKLKRRHPHVFGSVSVSSADEVNRNWEEIKKAEKAERSSAAGTGPASVLDGVAFGQPALSLAAQLQRRAGRAGFPLEDSLAAGRASALGVDGGPSKAGGADGAGGIDGPGGIGGAGGAGETEPASGDHAGVGDELMAIVARAREAGVDPELALREAARRFADHVRDWERRRPD